VVVGDDGGLKKKEVVGIRWYLRNIASPDPIVVSNTFMNGIPDHTNAIVSLGTVKIQTIGPSLHLDHFY